MATAPGIDTAITPDIREIRKDFPVLDRKVNGRQVAYLDSAASSQRPDQVLEAVNNYYRHKHANVHRGVHQMSQEATEAFEDAREAVRLFLGAGSDREIIFTRGTTESVNLVAQSYGQAFLEKDSEVLISGMEHHSNIVPWQMACERSGAILRVIPVTDKGEIDLEAYQSLLTDKTRIVAVTHVSNTLGTINPVEDIIRIARDAGVPVLLDGAQATPHMRINLRELDADFYAFSGHKMYGPTGIGILYGKEKWLDKIPPYQGGGEMIRSVTFEKTTYADLPHKFEAGTPNIAGAVGLHAAVEYLGHFPEGWVSRHEQGLLEYGTQQLLEIPGLRLVGTAAQKASVISFVIDGTHPYDVGVILDQLGVAVRTGHHCTQPLMDRFGLPGTVRASFALYNTTEEVDRLVEATRRAAKMLL